MTMGVERTLTTSLNASSSREEDQFDESFSSRSKYVLSASFSELSEETFSVVDRVILCLSAEGELLVLKKTSEFPTKFSLVRKHDLRTSQIMEHPLLPDAMRVQAAGTVLVYVYQMVKDSTKSTLKKWISKVSYCRAKSKDKRAARANTHSRIGPKVAKNGLLPKLSLGNKSKSTTTAAEAAGNCSSSRAYSSPSSPVAQNRSVLSAVLASRSQPSSGSSLQREEEEEQLPPQEEPEELEEADSVACTATEEAEENGSSCDIEDIVVITNGHCDDVEDDGDDDRGETPLSVEVTSTGETPKEKPICEIQMMVNGYVDDISPEGTSNAVDDGSKADDVEEQSMLKPVDLAAYDKELDLLRLSRDHRSSLRLDLNKSSDITRTSSDRYLGYHRALSAIEEGAVLSTKFCKSSSSASKLDELKESRYVLLEENGGLVPPQANGETRSQGSSTPTSSPLTPSTPRTPSPPTPIPPASESSGFLGRFHHMQIRNRKVKCSPRINRSISVQPNETHLASLIGSLTNSPTVTSRCAEINARRSATPTHKSSGVSVLTSSPRHPSGCSTLPRSHKSSAPAFPAHSVDPNAGSMGQFAPSSPVPAKQLPKSPRLLRIFHRRWQSQSAIKIPLNFDDDNLPSPSGSVPSTPIHASSTHLPPRLHLYNSLEVAQELSILDGELLRKIDPEELKNGAWMKKNKDSLAPNVMAMVQSFNQLALLVPSEILEEKTPQGRAKVISSYIQIASKCYRLRNYNSLKAVLAGLQCTPIFRLKKTWKEVPSKRKKRFDQLAEVMSEADNGQCYQTEVEKLLKSQEAFIPFLGFFLTQVVHQSSYDEIRAKREKSTGSSVSAKSEDSQTPPSPSCHVIVREPSGIQVPKSIDRTHRRSSSLVASLADRLNEDTTVLSKSAPSTPLPDGDEEIDWAGHSENSLADHDSGLYSSSSHRSASIPKSSSLNSLSNEVQDIESTLEVEEDEGRCSSTAMAGGGSDVDLQDIYLRLKRKSKSYESHLNAYAEENTGLKSVIHSTLTELARLSANLDGDSVYSEDEDVGENDASSISLDLTFSDHCSETSLLQNSYDASMSSSQILQAALNDDTEATLDSGEEQSIQAIIENRLREYERLAELSRDQMNGACGTLLSRDAENTPTTEAAASQPKPLLLRAQSEMTSLKSTLQELEREGGETPLQSGSEVPESEEGKGDMDSKKKRSIHRSFSQNNPGIAKVMWRRRRRKKSSSVCEEQLVASEQEKNTEPPSPSQMLNKFKISSLGCAVGLESKLTLRSLICDTQPNTERDNYKLSVDREQ